jgi:hypothetical protein
MARWVKPPFIHTGPEHMQVLKANGVMGHNSGKNPHTLTEW